MARQDIYQAVTDRIIELLDHGTVPWRHPISNGPGGGFPSNLVSGKPYRGINVFLLACTAMCEGYRSPYWLTYKQAKAKGGQVRKGEKSSLVVFWKKYKKEDPETGKDKVLPVIRHYNVFNTQQCDGLPPGSLPENTATECEDSGAGTFEPIENAVAIVSGFRGRPSIEDGWNQACYSPLRDQVRMPKPEDCVNPERYYATLFHELVHSTGHSKRLDRGLDKNLSPFGSADYSKEELVAEMGAAFLSASAGISHETIEQSAAYIDGWRRKLKGDKKLVVQASGAAQRAADHILGVSWDEATTSMQPASTVATNDNHLAIPSDNTPQVRDLAAALQDFPRPGQANLNSTASSEQRSAYISAVLGWWNNHVDEWTDQGLIDPAKNPAIFRPTPSTRHAGPA